MTNNIFFLIPLRIIQGLIPDGGIVKSMYHLGIYNSAQRAISTDVYSGYREFTYCLYTNNKHLPDFLGSIPDDFMENFPFDYDYMGFTGIKGGFEAFEEINYLEEYGQSHPEFADDVQEWYKVREFYKMAGLNQDTAGQLITSVKKLQALHDLKSTPLIAINSETMHYMSQDCLNGTAEKRAKWAMYLGVLSLIGKEEYVATTSEAIKCRMFGAKSKEELSLALKDPQTKRIYERYITEYRYKKLLNILQDSDMITELGFRMRTYLSVKAKTPKQLVQMIQRDELSKQRKRQRDEEKKKAREQLKAVFANSEPKFNNKQSETVNSDVLNRLLEKQGLFSDPSSMA